MSLHQLKYNVSDLDNNIDKMIAGSEREKIDWNT